MASVFFSYAHADEALRDKLEVQLSGLKRQGIIETWHDRRIEAGSHVDHTISRELEAADIILLLISANFINSDYCYD
ncbi:toll/interleukin-1 receptor domain-containing protein [Muricoccus vinaceus]|uniref:Toll/interleukin-1 receptor domain-containing protein n=1 Tax=Muricoccus vinaceus TaxID=424704 RepID=A0ABV6IVK6_9PROT